MIPLALLGLLVSGVLLHRLHNQGRCGCKRSWVYQ